MNKREYLEMKIEKILKENGCNTPVCVFEDDNRTLLIYIFNPDEYDKAKKILDDNLNQKFKLEIYK